MSNLLHLLNLPPVLSNTLETNLLRNAENSKKNGTFVYQTIFQRLPYS